MIAEKVNGPGVIGRGSKQARNKFYKMAQPLIGSGDRAGQRDTMRITAKIQVIPDGAKNQYGEKRLTGFTLDEIQSVADGNGPIVQRDFQERIVANVTLGPGIDQWTKEELYEIVDTVRKEGGAYLQESPMDVYDLQRNKLMENQGAQPVNITITPDMLPKAETPAPKKRGRPPKNASPTAGTDGPAETGDADSEDTAS